MRAERSNDPDLRKVALTVSLLVSCADAQDDLEVSTFVEAAEALQVAPGSQGGSVPSVIRFVGARVEGEGCRFAREPALPQDGVSVALYFDDFRAEFSSPAKYALKTCYIYYQLAVPPGYTYTVSNFSYSLMGIVPPNVRASLNVAYYFEGQGIPAENPIGIPSTPYGDITPYADTHNVNVRKYAPCSVRPQLVAQVTLNLKQRAGTEDVDVAMLRLDAAQASASPEAIAQTPVTLELEWARCSPESAQPGT